ncbi:OmpH family outer membrane protein [Flavobacterium silvaticum]|uniref:OmpH family outer membrane protein n=1 Tax=Flavobacterium silvaticum TaxID=1852020 RepID=A0A972FK83_9FLAO|nr:OmpH family outer membrane protein [Flavobacterium silvaticum]NMH27511.1 OmpH family outer membrane protein [Flavobacterium silvaticum]
MKNVIFYVAALLCLFTSKIVAQETFEAKARIIADKIEQITKEEKDALKGEVDRVNENLEKGTISPEQADQQKIDFAQFRANNIERRTAAAQDELRKLVQEKVDGQVASEVVAEKGGFKISYNNNNKKKDTIPHSESRTTSQAVFAFGLNNLLTDGALAHSDYRIWGSHYYEYGFTLNTRLAKNHNLVHLTYGLSVQLNNLRSTNKRVFEVDGNQTNLVNPGIGMRDTRFKAINMVVPVHLEFDFTKPKMDGDKKIFKTHDSFRVGLGGYAGANLGNRQFTKYDNEAGNTVKSKEKGDFNVNDFVYGLSAYVGYGDVSLFAKYDLQPFFTDNAIDQNNISFGVRFDWN